MFIDHNFLHTQITVIGSEKLYFYSVNIHNLKDQTYHPHRIAVMNSVLALAVEMLCETRVHSN